VSCGNFATTISNFCIIIIITTNCEHHARNITEID